MHMEHLKLSPLLKEAALADRVNAIGTAIKEQFKDDEEIVAICVLKGSFMFFSDLIRAIDSNVICEFFGVSSYHGASSSGEVKLTLDLNTPIENKNVVLVEDIVDTGLTMNYLIKNISARSPKSLTTVTLLHKPAAKKVDCKLDHVGFEIENNFVVGYGLDYLGYYRNLPYIAEVQNIN